MLGKKGNGAVGGQTLNTIIGRGTVFEGVMKVDNSVRIDGIFKGELACSGTLTISQSGEAYARLEGKDIYVNGVVRGTARAAKVRLDSQARFTGDVYTDALAVSEGAVFHGSCAMDAADEVEEPQATPQKAQAIQKAQRATVLPLEGKPKGETDPLTQNLKRVPADDSHVAQG